MRANASNPAQPVPWRPPYWPFHVPASLGAWLRWTARIWLVVATLIFGAMAVRGAIPRGLDPENIELVIQLGLFAVVILGELIAWRYQAAGASIIMVAGVGLGVYAAIQYTPTYAFGIALVFFVPAFLYWLDWQRTRSVRTIFVLAGSMALLLAAGGIRAEQIWSAYNGPTHPASALKALPVTLVRWVWSGAQSTDSVTVKAELARDSDAVYLAVSEQEDMSNAVLFGPASANAGNNRIVSLAASGLTPGVRYHYAVQADGEMDRSRQGQFRTFDDGSSSFTFAVGSCARTGSSGQVYDRIREADPLFFLVTGDLFYENIAANDPAAFRAAYNKVHASPAQSALYRSTSIVYTWDDHDFGPNNSDGTSMGKAAAQTAYRQVVPHYDLPGGAEIGPIYYAFTVGRVRFIVLDSRSEKMPPSTPDTEVKTMLGAEQKAWLKQELLAAKDTHALTVLVSSVPWIGKADGTSDLWPGYATERQEIADFIAANGITNLMMLAGDAHMVAADDGSNSDYATSGGAGFPVFHAAALDRPGSTKGGPYSEGAYPGGGQFGLVTVQDSGNDLTVTFSGRTWTGEELVSYTFTVPARVH